jgi:hypothetical protein
VELDALDNKFASISHVVKVSYAVQTTAAPPASATLALILVLTMVSTLASILVSTLLEPMVSTLLEPTVSTLLEQMASLEHLALIL